MATIAEFVLKGLRKIPNYDRYCMDVYGNVFVKCKGALGGEYTQQLIAYRDLPDAKPYVILRYKNQQGKNVARRFFLDELLDMAFPDRPDSTVRTVIKYPSQNGRAVLNRFRVINHLLRFNPEVQIPLMRNRDGQYETSAGMERMGMHSCQKCGEFGPVEVVICKFCGEWNTTPPSQ
jgi:hypothetical protein